jgi:predicted metal-dependent peptidase
MSFALSNPRQLPARDRVARQKIQLLLFEPFFGVLLTRLTIVWVTSEPIPTAATDGIHLWLNERYILGLDDDELRGLLVEEVLHVALGHCLRRGQREPKRWNIAADYVIGHLAIDAGYKFGPECVIEADRHEKKYHGMAVENIYPLLPEPPPEQGGGGQGHPTDQLMSGNLRPSGGQVVDHPSVAKGESAIKAVEAEIKIAVSQAAMAQNARNRGQQPAWMKSLLANIMEPKVSWVNVLRRFVTKQFPVDYTWSRPNRRFVHRKVYLPSALKEGIGELVIYWDSSGSCISFWPQMAGEVNAILEKIKPTKVHLIQCDASVGSWVTLPRGAKLPMEVTGHGGSDFRPAFAEVEKRRVRPVAAIVLSDMDIAFPSAKPSYPVLLVSTTKNPGPKWGTAHIRIM